MGRESVFIKTRVRSSAERPPPPPPQLDYYPPLTEYVDVAIATPVYVVRFEIGSSRGMGQVVGIKARDPDGAWMQIYEGRAMTEVGKTYKETKRYWQWSAEVCRTHFLASVFRIEVDTTAEWPPPHATCWMTVPLPRPPTMRCGEARF